MTEEERNLDLIIGDLEHENRLLRARNERLEKRDLTNEEIGLIILSQEITLVNYVCVDKQTEFARAIIEKMKDA